MGDRKIEVPTHAIEQITPGLKAALNETKSKLKSSDRRQFTLTLQKPEGFRVKAPEGEVVVLYFEPSATQNLKSSGFPEG